MRLTVMFLLLGLPALAQSPVIRADLDGNGHAESFRVVVPADDPRADLEVAGQWETTIYPNLGWAGAAAGTLPYLELASNGSLRLITENIGIGRNRWEQILTIAHRDGAYRVAGFTYTWYDTLDLAAGGICDINLLTGRGILQQGQSESRQIRDWSLRAPLLADWTAETMPDLCRAAVEAG